MRQANVVVATVLAAALASATMAAAQPKPGAQTKPSSPAAAPGLSPKPYLRLFEQHRSEASVPFLLRVRVPLPNPLPSKTCGMIVLPPDPRIDPKFEVPLRDTTTQFAIRTVPVLCH